MNGLLDAEADRLCQAKRYERVADRVDTRAGHYERGLQTQAGEVELKAFQAADIAVRDGDHRAVSPPGKLGRGSLAGDVLRRSVDAAGRRHHGRALGRPREPQHHKRAEPEGVREDR